ncbi:hypothetical protein K3N28_06150 [Glycomyces sp. TRM65418]|uniref:hypothetical protein n=1 Tax=Glycomyces sp. TRM65418 TaxID=2867006 RepID=UPI001CE6E270|nr:hypothetical protein [Glycomyces sp. TRM65418]MCC3762651.1 hypothetical protein [Glycomyces sp. TRM65418]QZD56688.1 hypothetical protein K3N28_06110 [Glycomyces sp. TRM65418]
MAVLGLRSARGLIKQGQRRAAKGDIAGATEAFQRAMTARQIRGIDNLFAALHLWILRSEAEDQSGAHSAFMRAAELHGKSHEWRTQGKPSGNKSLALGTGIAAYWTEFNQPARTALHRCIEIGDQEQASHALLALAGLELQTMEEMHGMIDTRDSVFASLRRVVGLGHPECAPVAAEWLRER